MALLIIYMKMSYKYAVFTTVLLLFLHFDNELFALNLNNNSQDDTVYINDVSIPPVIDGNGNDLCWQSASWQSINEVWIPWGMQVDSLDYFGRYKTVWSSSQNLLYFLVEINDDTVSDGFVSGESSDIYNFDMIEVFIDENKSGGYHVFDGTADNEASLGTNAENAFGYHIFANIPDSGTTSYDFIVGDLAGKDWSHTIPTAYKSHFPGFAIRSNGHVITREFSLIVYNDTYSASNISGSRVQLTKDKIMGLSLAFNDDDQPAINPQYTERDNFFGSVSVSELAYNDHWKNADDFGTAKLISSISTVYINDKLMNSELMVFPNPLFNDVTVKIQNKQLGPMEICLFNVCGEKVKSILSQKYDDDYLIKFPISQLEPGTYFIQVLMESDYQLTKIIICR
jgi:hypothetical protein